MRINVLALPSNSNAEPAANARDRAESSPEGGFFAQIDQIWNQNRAADAAAEERPTDQDEPKAAMEPLTMTTAASRTSGNPLDQIWNQNKAADDAIEEKPTDQEEAKAEMDPLTMAMGISLTPGNPQPLVAQPESPADYPSQIQHAPSSIQTSEQTNARAHTLDITSMAALFVKEAGNLLNASVLIESGHLTIGAFNGARDSSTAAAVELDSEQKTSGNALNPDLGPEHPQSSVSKKVLDPSMPIAAAEPSNASQDANLIAQAAAEHSRNLSRRADANAAAEKVELPDSLRMSAGSDKTGDTVPAAVQAKSENLIARANLENAGTDNSHTDRENSRNEGVSWTVQTSQPANAQKDSTKVSFSIAERPQDVSSQMAASPVRLAEAAVPAMTGGAEATASRPNEFVLQLADRIHVQLRDGKGEIRIQLQPGSLGHLEIRAESTLNGVVARIVAESSSIKNYLETNLHLLQQSLQDQGLKVDRIHVSVQDNSGFDSSAGYAAQSGHMGPGHQGRGNGRSGASGFPSIELPEELAVDPLTWVALNPNIRFHTIA
jgi:flagellar hook-length control protein FliK